MTSPTWDPGRYLRHCEHRVRPAVDLLAQIDVSTPGLVHDLGCGTGNVTRIMRARWPQAHIIASDSSAEMLDAASAQDTGIEWRLADARSWDEPAVYDVIYSNAVLHWIPDHDDVIVRLLGSLRPGGVLAVQMPLSWYEPSHELIRTIVDDAGLGSPQLRRTLAAPNVAPPEHYVELLGRHARTHDVWTTRYYQALRGSDPMLDWVSGTGLRPILDQLSADELAIFLPRYAAALRTAYPQRSDGTTLFPFPRLFFVASV